jgi:hypothetical protein
MCPVLVDLWYNSILADLAALTAGQDDGAAVEIARHLHQNRLEAQRRCNIGHWWFTALKKNGLQVTLARKKSRPPVQTCLVRMLSHRSAACQT